MPIRLCLILDLNGTLIYRSVRPLKNIQYDIKVNGKYIYFRPHLVEFFDFLAAHRDSIELGIWTSMTAQNAYEIVSHLWKKIFLPQECCGSGLTRSLTRSTWTADQCDWGGKPFLTDEGFLEDTKDKQLRQLYQYFIYPLQNKTPIPIHFLFTQQMCLTRRKNTTLDAPDFREFKPVMFKHLPLLWNTQKISDSEVERIYGRAVVTKGGNYSTESAGNFKAQAFTFPKLSQLPSAFLQEQVLLLEDSHYKFLAAPYNGLVIPEYCPHIDEESAKGSLLLGSTREIQDSLSNPLKFPQENNNNTLKDLVEKLESFLNSDLSIVELLQRH